MGSFSYTCAVSNLPIHSGDPVRFVLLQQSSFHRGADTGCRPHSQWCPRTFPIKGKYNDYGTIEDFDKDSSEVKLFLLGLQTDLEEKEVGENEYHDLAVKKTDTFDQFLETLRANRVSVKNITSQVSSDIGVCMIREDVWQAMLTYKFESWCHDSDGNFKTQVIGLDFYKERLQKEIYSFKDKKLKLSKLKKTINESNVKKSFKAELESFNLLIDHTSRQNSIFNLGEGQSYNTLPEHFRLSCDKKLLNKKLQDNMAETVFVWQVLDLLRIQWKCSSSSGPQHSDWSDHVKWLEKLLAIAKVEAKKQED